MKRLIMFSTLLLLAAGEAKAFGPRTQFRLALLSFEPAGNDRLAGLERLAYEVRKRTSVEAAPKPVVLTLDSPELFDFPFLVFAVCQAPPALTAGQIRTLRRYLDAGGFLFVDNCQGRPGAAEDWIHAELGRMYPGRAFKPVPADHSVYRTFYLLDRAFGRTAARTDLEGLDDGDRTVVLVNPNDLLGALLRDPFGNPVFDLPERGRELAQRQGVNIVLYALTLNYKKDQIHIPFILKRRQK